MAAVTALLLALALGPPLIRLLKRRQIGQSIRQEGPKSHLSKAGTPTMGGLLILLIVIGARLGEMTTGGYTLLEAPVPRQKLVHVHPGAEEIGRGGLVSVRPFLPLRGALVLGAATIFNL